MNDMEELLRRDRAAGVPEAPDVRYTVAAVRRKLGDGPGRGADAPRPSRSEDWPLLLMAAATLVVAAGAALAYGLSPWWLLAVPFSALPLCPILLRKGV